MVRKLKNALFLHTFYANLRFLHVGFDVQIICLHVNLFGIFSIIKKQKCKYQFTKDSQLFMFIYH